MGLVGDSGGTRGRITKKITLFLRAIEGETFSVYLRATASRRIAALKIKDLVNHKFFDKHFGL